MLGRIGSFKFAALLAASLMSANLVAPSQALASPCVADSLSAYTTPGFNCTIGDLQFSAFSASANFVGTSTVRTANGPDAIVVTPQNTSGGIGLAFSNMDLSFTGTNSNTNSRISFFVEAQSGLITDADLMLGDHSYTGPGGSAIAHFGDLSNAIFNLNVTDPSASQASTTFPGVLDFTAYTMGGTAVSGFQGGTAYLDGYTVLLSTEVGTVPEAGTIALLGIGLAGLGFSRRRQRA